MKLNKKNINQKEKNNKAKHYSNEYCSALRGGAQ
jgi:hypothetical protein